MRYQYQKWIKSSALIALLFGFQMLSAQEDWGCAKPNKKAEKLFEKARGFSFRGKEAYKLMTDAISIDPNYTEALSMLAYLNGKKDQTNPQNKNRTIDYYERTHRSCPAYRDYDAAYVLAKHYYSERKFDVSWDLLITYLDKVNRRSTAQYKEALQLKKQIEKYKEIFDNPVPFEPVKVSGASTELDEYLPMLSPDNQFLFYTRKAKLDGKSAVGSEEKEVFIQSRKQYNGKYSNGIPMPTPFNKGAYQGGSSISIDNRLLFITIVSQSVTRDGRGYSNGDIYYSERSGGQWTELKSIGNHINGKFTWEGQPSISADNKTLYFASARAENIGGAGMDLYKSERQADGSWGPAINLGPEVNTSGNEKSPFMHSDSKTLYFSSDGHPGVGGQDIFYTRINDFGKFDLPTNLGIPINTEEDEHGFMVSTDGKYGYFSSNMEDEGLDIYAFEIPEEARPEEVVFVKGSVASKDPDAAKGMSIELKNMSTDEVVEGVVDEENGEYVAVISAREQEDVMMMAKKNGYAFTSQYINTGKDLIGTPTRMEAMEFQPIEAGETYQINNINFATDSYTLNQQVMNILSEFIVFLKENETVRVAIHGHTDNVGDDQENLILSENRAKAVYQYLILEDIDPSRLEYKGFGETSPIAVNDTEEGRLKNRRTEFVILSK